MSQKWKSDNGGCAKTTYGGSNPPEKTAKEVRAVPIQPKDSHGKQSRDDLVNLQWYSCPATDAHNGGSPERSSGRLESCEAAPAAVLVVAQDSGSSVK